MKRFLNSFFQLEDDEFEEQQSEQATQPKKVPVQAAVKEPLLKPKRARQLTEVSSGQQAAAPQEKGSNKVVNIQTASSAKHAKLVLFEPRVYAEAQDIAENIKNKRATIVNLQRIDREQGVRIIDFLSGTVYALGGEIQRVGNDIFLCTPENMEVSGEITDYIDI